MKRILVALDNSTRAPFVLQTASRLAAMTDSDVILYRAVTAQPLDVEQLASAARAEDVLVRRAHTELEELAKSCKAPIEAIIANLATPADGILHTARERDADMIVIGSHGHGLLERLIGTTAQKVVERADRNVLVARTLL
ncbi:MAG: universal stress protein [Kofleriaceae bacterium]